MTKSFKLCPLLLCLLCTMAQASHPSQNDFDFLEPFNDTALVENGLELTGSIAGVALSTLLNLGIWWAVCKAAGIVSGLSSKYDLAESDTKELGKLKTDFCMQLASVVTTAEVALAGHVSPWPLKQCWWKPLHFAGAGMAAYATMTAARARVPVAVLVYLASEAVTRTGASTISTLILRNMSVRDIPAKWYKATEYTLLSGMNGIIAGAVMHEVMIHKGSSAAKVALASVVSAAITSTLSGIFSMLMIDVDGQVMAWVVPVAGVGAGAMAGALGTTGIEAVVGVIAGVCACAGALPGVGATTIIAVENGAEVGLGAGIEFGAGVGIAAGSFALGGVTALLMLRSSKTTTNNPFIKAGITLVPALTFAVINSLSNYAVYGYPLEEGLSETSWTQWKKFYAPLDYLSTLFK
ncbi:hypothetical protein [Endozoicomonas sp. 4G]|uniref:hypothetical protein n=1 Tax=Endozoicomonas sp. 4G TaxID=2872754 RepID=UPI002078EF3A|nr:hypothetical protein [Endozoicomonas sp. 4G]